MANVNQEKTSAHPAFSGALIKVPLPPLNGVFGVKKSSPDWKSEYSLNAFTLACAARAIILTNPHCNGCTAEPWYRLYITASNTHSSVKVRKFKRATPVTVFSKT